MINKLITMVIGHHGNIYGTGSVNKIDTEEPIWHRL